MNISTISSSARRWKRYANSRFKSRCIRLNSEERRRPSSTWPPKPGRMLFTEACSSSSETKRSTRRISSTIPTSRYLHFARTSLDLQAEVRFLFRASMTAETRASSSSTTRASAAAARLRRLSRRLRLPRGSAIFLIAQQSTILREWTHPEDGFRSRATSFPPANSIRSRSRFLQKFRFQIYRAKFRTS